MKIFEVISIGLILLISACSPSPQRVVSQGAASRGAVAPRGIADKRSDFREFLPLDGDLARYGLKAVHPQFRAGDREAVVRAIEAACQGGKAGSSEYDPRTEQGYYVNCNPKNRQLLNGYVPLDPRTRPHSAQRQAP